MTFNELLREALQLDPSTRARLAHELLSSLESLTDAEDAIARARARRR